MRSSLQNLKIFFLLGVCVCGWVWFVQPRRGPGLGLLSPGAFASPQRPKPPGLPLPSSQAWRPQQLVWKCPAFYSWLCGLCLNACSSCPVPALYLRWASTTLVPLSLTNCLHLKIFVFNDQCSLNTPQKPLWHPLWVQGQQTAPLPAGP